MYTYERNELDPRFPFTATGDYVFETEREARNFCKMWNDYFIALKTIEDVPDELSREDYETACQEANVPALADGTCNSYAVKYGEFVPWLDGEEIDGYSPQDVIEMSLARKRMKGITAEKKAKPRPATKLPELVRCDCGHSVSAILVMSASRGSSCPDCYDRMSE